MSTKERHFWLEQMCDNYEDIQFYTGFISYSVLLPFFFTFLCPSVNNVKYWSGREVARLRKRPAKQTPMNPFFMTLICLKLNLQLRDLAKRFGILTSLTSQYIIT